MSSITKSIQNEYVLLMENAFSEKYKYAFRNLELKELRRFILKELISSPELDNQLTNLIVLLNKFWDTHAAALITEVRASKSYRLLLPIQRFGYNISNHLMAGFFMPARRVLREIVCRIAGAINRIRAASRQGRDQTYGPEVF